MKIMTPEEAIASGWPKEPWPEELTPEQVKEAYALLRAAFTADDLQRFTEVEEGIPIEEVLAEMEKTQQEFDKNRAANERPG